MSYAFGDTSAMRLSTCHPKLQEVFNEVIKHYDCSILCGFRDEESQASAYARGASTVQFPNSKHNQLPSIAVDCCPYPIEWKDTERFYHFAGFVLGIAAAKGIKLRFGGDWDGDMNLKDQNFDDLPHFELVE